jgi:hypothetical protein
MSGLGPPSLSLPPPSLLSLPPLLSLSPLSSLSLPLLSRHQASLPHTSRLSPVSLSPPQSVTPPPHLALPLPPCSRDMQLLFHTPLSSLLSHHRLLSRHQACQQLPVRSRLNNLIYNIYIYIYIYTYTYIYNLTSFDETKAIPHKSVTASSQSHPPDTCPSPPSLPHAVPTYVHVTSRDTCTCKHACRRPRDTPEIEGDLGLVLLFCFRTLETNFFIFLLVRRRRNAPEIGRFGSWTSIRLTNT